YTPPVPSAPVVCLAPVGQRHVPTRRGLSQGAAQWPGREKSADWQFCFPRSYSSSFCSHQYDAPIPLDSCHAEPVLVVYARQESSPSLLREEAYSATIRCSNFIKWFSCNYGNKFADI